MPPFDTRINPSTIHYCDWRLWDIEVIDGEPFIRITTHDHNIVTIGPLKDIHEQGRDDIMPYNFTETATTGTIYSTGYNPEWTMTFSGNIDSYFVNYEVINGFLPNDVADEDIDDAEFMDVLSS